MNKYKSYGKGWHFESIRHSLAAKGIKTWQKEYKSLVKSFPGENPRLTKEFARFRQEDPGKYNKFRVKKTKDGKELVFGRNKKTHTWELQSVLVKKSMAGKYDNIKKHPEAYDDVLSNRILKHRAKFEELRNIKYVSKEELDAFIAEDRAIREEIKQRSSFAAKDYSFIGTADESPGKFIKENLRATEDHSIEHYAKGVEYVLKHPLKDLDGDWESYNESAGNGHVELSKHPIERAEERGAALFGRVLSQANMEPLIERGQGRTFREITMDVAFGRRSGVTDDSELHQKSQKSWHDRIKGGLADKKKPSDFDQKQLADGVKVEMEHTSNPLIAKEIAMDHLTEDKLYYKKLELMEKKRHSMQVEAVGAVTAEALAGAVAEHEKRATQRQAYHHAHALEHQHHKDIMEEQGYDVRSPIQKTAAFMLTDEGFEKPQ
jgi:hypothetical protein